ncbi:hypothetical protein SAMN05421553_2596 [Pseudomonas anguilliseptica]|uniref:Uncharacterized protein n=1 Tax=Pseudomonas anguilliseptica TaxID=53406 RepID=A0A1H5AF97_PSEAG|nr:hypothetical protein SAMN05421553_2596 [Pseudomonas anguilliseptica]
MRLLLLCLTLLSSAALAGANCANSQSWQCQHHSAATGSSNPQQPTPDHQTSNPPTQTTNPPLGSLTPDIHGVALTPVAVPNLVPTPIQQPVPTATPYKVPQPMNIPGQVPTPTPQAVPTATPYMVPQPMNIPGQVPTPTPQAIPTATPYMVPQPMNIPGQVPTPTPQAVPTATPYKVPQPMSIPGQVPTPTPQAVPTATPYKVPQPMNIPGQVPTSTPTPQPVPTATKYMVPPIAHGGRPTLLIKPGSTATQKPPTQTNHVVTHQLQLVQPLAKVPLPTTGDAQAQYGLEMIEPGVQNHRVEVYRSHDALEQIHNDVIPMDEGDFHLTVIGTRKPDYMHDQP